MSDTLYIQTDMNILIKHPHVYLQDIARLSCSNSKVLNRLRVLPVANLNPDTPGRYTMSVMDLVDLIQKKEPDLDITPLGELSFILTYQPPGKPQMIFEILKVVFISLASFFGAAFFKECGIYIVFILPHLHLHGGRISRKLLSPEVVKEEKNTGSKSNGIGNFKYRKSTGDISGHLLVNLLKKCSDIDIGVKSHDRKSSTEKRSK